MPLRPSSPSAGDSSINVDVSVLPPLSAEEERSILTSEHRKRRFLTALVEGQKLQDITLKEYFDSKRDYFRRLDTNARSKYYQDVDMSYRYYDGDQYCDYDEHGKFVSYTRTDGDFAYTIPVYKGHVDQVFTQLIKTALEYDFDPHNDDDALIINLVKMCGKVATEEKDRLLTDDVRADEILNSILAGQSHRRLLWAVNPRSPKTVSRVKYKKTETPVPARRECQKCYADVPTGAVCPSCGGAEFVDIAASTKAEQVEDGTFEAQLGENMLDIPHPTSVQSDLSARRFQDSTFIIQRDYLPLHIAQWTYQTIINTPSRGLSEESQLRQEQERASMQTDSEPGSARTPAFFGAAVPIEREFIFMDPSEYGAFFVRREEILPDGTRIPANTLLGHHYPNGAALCYVGDELIGVKGVNKRREWTIVLYGKRPGSSRGSGLMALLSLQDIVNDCFNLDYAILMTSARPLTAVWRHAIKQLPEAGQFLFIDKMPPSGMDGVVKQFPGQAANGIVGATSDRIEAAMQFIAGDPTLTGNYGAPDNKVMGTATGVAASQENASSRQIGPIKQIIAADVEFFFQILENIQEHSAPEQKAELAKRFGDDIAAAFFTAKFRQILNITVAKNSDMPQSRALTQAKVIAFGQFAQAFAKVQAPWATEVMSTMADLLGVSVNLGPGRTDRREAEYQLNKLIAIEQRIKDKNPELLLDAQAAAEQMFVLLEKMCGPVSNASAEAAQKGGSHAFQFMLDHPTFKDVFKDFLQGEKSKSTSDALRLVVVQLWMEHHKAEMARQMLTTQFQAELEAELNPQPEVPPAPTEEELAAQQDAQDERMVAGQMLERKADEEAKDKDLQRSLAEKEADAINQIAVSKATAAEQQPANA